VRPGLCGERLHGNRGDADAEDGPGSSFADWSGDACSSILSNGACQFTASGLKKSFTATLRLKKPGPGRRVPPRGAKEVVVDVVPALCAANSDTLKIMPNGDTTPYLCVRPVSSPHDAYLTYDLARLSLSLSGDI
jgi:hypothetical protein